VGSVGSGHGPVAGCCECGDKPSGSGAMELVMPVYHGTVPGVPLAVRAPHFEKPCSRISQSPSQLHDTDHNKH
jgi:hypothetical protein